MITSREMRELEELSEKEGVSKSELMENAGKAVCEFLKTNFELKSRGVLVVCYHGNNGGDGFVAARRLASECSVRVLFLGNEEKLSEEARKAWEKLPMGIVARSMDEAEFEGFGIIIDAMLGTGAKGELREPLRSAVQRINQSRAVVVSLDVPTGMDPDSEKNEGLHVMPQVVIAFHDAKPCLRPLLGRCVIADIGIPESAVKRQREKSEG